MLDSIAAERRRIDNTKHSFPSRDSTSLLLSLKDTQEKLLATIEHMRHELSEERRIKELLLQEIRNLQGSSVTRSINRPSVSGLSQVATESDPKYKELKKKLLMANLKILELQNKKSASDQK